jgi:hypothetical protein
MITVGVRQVHQLLTKSYDSTDWSASNVRSDLTPHYESKKKIIDPLLIIQ